MKQHILYWLIVYDIWCEDRVKALLVWLDEWFSISQKRAEEGMIVLYLVMAISASRRIFQFFGLDIVTWIFVGGAMIWLHQKPAARRGIPWYFLELHLLRVCFQALMFAILCSLIFIPPHCVQNITIGVAQIVYVVFFYMTDIRSNGKHGRRRKLALAELKKLFGTAWIPKPVPEPE